MEVRNVDVHCEMRDAESVPWTLGITAAACLEPLALNHILGPAQCWQGALLLKERPFSCTSCVSDPVSTTSTGLASARGSVKGPCRERHRNPSSLQCWHNSVTNLMVSYLQMILAHFSLTHDCWTKDL